MKPTRYTRFYGIKIILTLLVGGLMAYVCAGAQAQSLTLIANPEGAPNDIQFDRMQNIFRAQQQRWTDGTKITLAMVKSSNPLAEAVADKVYGMVIEDVKKYWIQVVFRGRASTPKYFDTEEEVKQYIAVTQGTIGIISAEMTDGTTRIVKVDGEDIW